MPPRKTVVSQCAATYVCVLGSKPRLGPPHSYLRTKQRRKSLPIQLAALVMSHVGRLAIPSDFDVLLAAHPGASLEGYLRAIEVSTLLGYHHSGFRDAQVQARYDEQQQRIVVGVNEGNWHLCGDVKITGLKQADS